VRAATADYHAFDRRAANTAKLAGARIDVMMQLEEAGDTVCVYIVRNRRASQLDSFGEHLDQHRVKTRKFGAGQAACVAGWADAGVEKALVCVDVAYAVQQRLIQQCSFDRGLPATKERDEIFKPDSERFCAGSGIFPFWSNGFHHGQAAEAAGIDEAKLFATAQAEDRVSVWRDRRVGRRDKQTSCHAEVDKKLRGFALVLFGASEINDDRLADAMDAVDTATGESLHNVVGCGLECLRLVAGPD